MFCPYPVIIFQLHVREGGDLLIILYKDLTLLCAKSSHIFNGWNHLTHDEGSHRPETRPKGMRYEHCDTSLCIHEILKLRTRTVTQRQTSHAMLGLK